MKPSKTKKKKEKGIFLIAVFLFAMGFMSLCQHMRVIKLGYMLGREKSINKELFNLNRSLYLEKTSLKSPRHLDEVACNKLGLMASPDITLRRISVVAPSKNSEDKNKTVKGMARFLGFDSKAIAKPAKK